MHVFWAVLGVAFRIALGCDGGVSLRDEGPYVHRYIHTAFQSGGRPEFTSWDALVIANETCDALSFLPSGGHHRYIHSAFTTTLHAFFAPRQYIVYVISNNHSVCTYVSIHPSHTTDPPAPSGQLPTPPVRYPNKAIPLLNT